MGALLLRKTQAANETHQVVYIAQNAQGFYLLEAAMKDLRLIPQDFPAPPAKVTGVQQPKKAPCDCLLRERPPSHPNEIPIALKPENHAKLEAWICNHYAASAFNVCPHQPLHTMSGKPLDITFKLDAVPLAVYCPIQVPHHWKKAVKADLDRDMALGIIEPIPQGTPTVWCSRMVVAPKKDGSP